MERQPLMGRRAFALGAIAWLSAPLAGQTQETAKPFRVGFLSGLPNHPLATLLLAALRERGWIEGRDFIIDRRNSGQDPERAVALAKELVVGSDAIVTVNTPHAVAARRATSSVPIVMFTSGFPVEAGLASSLAHPGGNVTGLSIYAGAGLFSKYVGLLREAVPSLRHLGVIWDYAPPGYGEKEVDAGLGELRRAARALNVTTRVWMVRADHDVTDALAAASNAPLDALFVTGGSIHGRHANAPRITEFAIRRRLPMLNDFRSGLFETGGFLSYSVDLDHLAARAAYFLERIRRGAKPADLPIEQPTRFQLTINMKTAKAIGLTIPPLLLLRADQVIE